MQFVVQFLTDLIQLQVYCNKHILSQTFHHILEFADFPNHTHVII